MAKEYVLLHSTSRGGHALYEDGALIANYSRYDTEKYIAVQLQQRGIDEVVERLHDGDFPKELPKETNRNARSASENS